MTKHELVARLTRDPIVLEQIAKLAHYRISLTRCAGITCQRVARAARVARARCVALIANFARAQKRSDGNYHRSAVENRKPHLSADSSERERARMHAEEHASRRTFAASGASMQSTYGAPW